MATTSMWAVRTRLDHLVEYVSNKEKTTLISTVIDYTTNAEKTMERQFVSCINCMQDDPYASMVQTKKLFHDEKEILCYHGYQSFSEGEVTPEQAHDIGVALANELWGEHFEVIVTTHLNTDNIHNHFLINATSCIMDELSNQTILLCEQNINTVEELNLYQAPLQKQIDELTYKRSQCYYRIRRRKSLIDKEPLKEEAKSYTPKIRELRKQIKLCEAIKIRSIEIQDINYELQKQVKNR